MASESAPSSNISQELHVNAVSPPPGRRLRKRKAIGLAGRVSRKRLATGSQTTNDVRQSEGVEASSETKNELNEGNDVDGDKNEWKRDVLPFLLAFYLPNLSKTQTKPGSL